MISSQAHTRAHLHHGSIYSSQLAVPKGMRCRQFRAMGTTVSLLLTEAHYVLGLKVTQDLFAEWEQTLSRFLPESELSYLNSQAGTPVEVSPLLFRVLYAACTAARETEGLFDPTLLTQLIQIGYDRSFDELPAVALANRQEPRSGGDWREIRLDHRRRRVTLPMGVSVEVGGIAKGMAVDAALSQLCLLGVQTALVNAGGDLAVMGLPIEQDSWPLTIAGKDTSWTIPFQYGALVTSGVDRRHWQQGDIQRHHIIDPRSGESAQSGLWSVTVAAGSCQGAEVAAKAAFLLGAEQGQAFLADRGLAGLLVCTDGSWTSAGSWPIALMQTMENEK